MRFFFDFSGQQVWSIDLDINELAPFFPVFGKPPHERSIAVPAGVATPHVRINGVVLDPRFGKDGFCKNLSNDHSSRTIICGCLNCADLQNGFVYLM
jgi:hypothetical protein